jgi:hypothetical protein
MLCVFSQRFSLLHACKFYGKLLKSSVIENSAENSKYITETTTIIPHTNACKYILLAKGLLWPLRHVHSFMPLSIKFSPDGNRINRIGVLNGRRLDLIHFPAGTWDFFLIENVQASSENQPAGIGDSYPGNTAIVRLYLLIAHKSTVST